jgi:hypothetical protein
MINSQTKCMKELAEEFHCCDSPLDVRGVFDVDKSEFSYLLICSWCKFTLVFKDPDQASIEKKTSNF